MARHFGIFTRGTENEIYLNLLMASQGKLKLITTKDCIVSTTMTTNIDMLVIVLV